MILHPFRLALPIVVWLAGAPSTGIAQTPDAAPIPIEKRTSGLRAGPFQHAGTSARTVAVGTVSVDGAASLRLDLTGTRLSPGSRLTIRSRDDGAEQWFDPDSLVAWRHGSAVFNGHAVDLSLRLAPGAAGDEVRVPTVEIGLPRVSRSDPTSLCGGDDRRPSQDPRLGRQYPTGCTVWLANEYTVVTAGHCTALQAQLVHFNVPASTATGQLRYPPPQDQYPYEIASLTRLDAGVGADWTVVRTVRNSNTQRYPGEVQGYFATGPVPTLASGPPIRITGYGTTASPIDPTRNQTQQTHVDALTQVAATYLRYVADTTGGNSGSPVIDARTGRVVGVHTHGGCSTGGNRGTRIDRPDLAAALRAALGSKILGRVEIVGQGCPGTVAVARLDAIGPPTLSRPTVLRLSGIAAAATAALVFGTSDRSWNGTTLPTPLPGAPGCAVHTSLDITYGGLSSPFGTYEAVLHVPADPALVGVTAYVQGFAFEPAPTGLRPVSSAGLRLVVGRDW